MGSQKVPGIVTLHSNGRTYGNTYPVFFKAGLLRAYTLVPSTLPLLEAPMQGFFWNIPELPFG
jgi:hypothetical protein